MKKTPELAVIVLAAGKGTRMKSELPKVMHPLAGKPMIHHILEAVYALKPARVLAVVGYGAEAVQSGLAGVAKACGADAPEVEFVAQREQLGTGHAVKVCEEALRGFDGRVVIVYGDVMLNARADVLPTLLEAADENPGGLTLLAATVDNPFGLGRIFEKDGRVVIVEEKDCSSAEREVKSANPGIYALPAPALWPLLHELKPANAQKELYLTDIIEGAARDGLKVSLVNVEATAEWLGINSREELAAMEAVMQTRLRKAHMANGVTLLDPSSVRFCTDTRIANDVVIEPNVVFGPGVTVASGVTIKAFSHIEGSTIAKGASVGPFARLRPGAAIGEGARIGNFVEIKNATIGADTAAGHLSYLGDVEIGAHTNIGAGTIIANYKHHTHEKWRSKIGDNVATGSGTVVVSPVTIGDNVATGAGTVVRHDVEDGALVVARPEVVVRAGYYSRKK